MRWDELASETLVREDGIQVWHIHGDEVKNAVTVLHIKNGYVRC